MNQWMVLFELAFTCTIWTNWFTSDVETYYKSSTDLQKCWINLHVIQLMNHPIKNIWINILDAPTEQTIHYYKKLIH